MTATMVTTSPDYWRQLDVFDPESFNAEVHIIGAGATGSWVTYILAKLGVSKIHVYDFDRVERHNLPNQIYGLQDLGKFKVEALAERIFLDCGIKITPHQVRVDGTQPLRGIVYLCTDTMSSRKQIWETAIRHNFQVSLMIETRLGAELGKIYTVRPINRQDIKSWEATLVTDEQAEQSACSYRAISTTVSTIAGLAAHKLVKFATGKDLSPVVEVKADSGNMEHASYEMFCIQPVLITAAAWKN